MTIVACYLNSVKSYQKIQGVSYLQISKKSVVFFRYSLPGVLQPGDSIVGQTLALNHELSIKSTILL